MSKETIRFLIDENVDAHLAPELRKRGIDAVNVQEINKRGIDDKTLLQLVTLYQRLLREDKAHYGIIVSKKTYIGTLIKDILLLIDTETNLQNKIIYL